MIRDGDRRKGPSFTSLAALSFILVVGYLLSPGPVFFLAETGYIPEDLGGPIGALYQPLQWGYDNVEWVKSFYDWYLDDLIGLG